MKTKKNKSSNKKKFKFLISVGRIIYRVCEFIYTLIDNFIIIPITKLMMFVMKFFKSNNKSFDRLLNNKIFLISFSLILSLFAFFIVDSVADTMLYSSADILYNQKVKAIYNEEAYVVEGLPDLVDITIIGSKSYLYLAKQYPDDEVVVDLSGLKPGTHKVPLKYSGTVSSVEYKPDPSVATIVIYEKISEEKSVTKEVVNGDKLDSKYTITDIKFNKDTVYIKGPKYKIDSVSIVKALVDVEKIVNPSQGTTVLKEIPLIAYDKHGEKVDVEILPEVVDASIDISSPSKDVNLKVIPNGTLSFGKSIESIMLSETKVTIYGDQSVLSGINYIDVPIDVNNLDSNKEFNVDISKPASIKEMSVKSVVVKLTVGDTVQTIIDDVNITTKNLASGYSVMASSTSDSMVSIIVKGTKTNIADANKDNITAYVNLQGLVEGTHTVAVDVIGSDEKLVYAPKTNTVTIVIKKN